MLRTLSVAALLFASAAVAQTSAPPANPPGAVPAPTEAPGPIPTSVATPTPTPSPTLSAAARNAVIGAALPPEQAAMKAHVMFLASDAMRGREAGSAEYDIAAQYVAAQFYAAGLRPAGDDGGYLQRVPLVSYKPADQGSFTLTRGRAAPETLMFGTDYLPAGNPARAVATVDAPVVFVGYGIVASQYRRDDYRGVDVRGKIVAFFGGAPRSFQPEERAHFSSEPTKARLAQDRGAVGYITLELPRAEGRVAAFTQRNWDRARVTWADADGSGHLFAPRVPKLGELSLAGAAKLFAGARTPWPRVARLAETNGATFRAEVLPGRLTASVRTLNTPLPSSNVAGLLPGGDPKLKDEVVVLSAHLDHVGVGEAVNGDTIYNGAEDNAVGIASLIEEARRFKASGTPPRRSILFLAVTAEEKGLVGADYFANNPTVPRGGIVANVNLDMPIITYRFEDMTVFGAERSTLGPIVRRAVAALGVGLAPDPSPEMGLFTRSDHYRFVQQGVPSVFLWPGHAGPGKAAWDKFFAQHYHKPSDEVGNPDLDWSQGVRFVEVNYAIAREIADANERPRWNRGDFFGVLYGGYGAR